MKIRKVKANNRRKSFEVETNEGSFSLPFAKVTPEPTAKNKITRIFVDKDLGNEAFTFILENGTEGSVHIDDILEYNKDPDYLKNLALYKLTLEVQKRIRNASLSKREIIRRLGTSAPQLYRLLDQTNYKKSIGQLLSLLFILDCEVDFVVKEKLPKSA